jgi:hypothetical protein
LRVPGHAVHSIVLARKAGAGRAATGERKHARDTAFRGLDARIVAVQEAESVRGGSDGAVKLARDRLLARNPGWCAAATGEWRDVPSRPPILSGADTPRLRHRGWFFFDRPDVIIASRFDGSCPVLTSRPEFALRKGRVFWVCNTPTGARRQPIALGRPRARSRGARHRPRHAGYRHGRFQRASRPGDGADRFRRLALDRRTGARMHLDRGIPLFGAIDHIGLSDAFELRAGPFVMWRS